MKIQEIVRKIYPDELPEIEVNYLPEPKFEELNGKTIMSFSVLNNQDRISMNNVKIRAHLLEHQSRFLFLILHLKST